MVVWLSGSTWGGWPFNTMAATRWNLGCSADGAVGGLFDVAQNGNQNRNDLASAQGRGGWATTTTTTTTTKD